jgi:NodT family efflux transporter outer membrane factor (OMF) lipoprotein
LKYLKRSGRLIAAGCIGLTGCTMLGPDFETPDAPVAPSWQPVEGEGISTVSSDHAQWWTTFEDETLNRLIDTAVKQNLPLQISGIRIFEARAQLGIAAGSQYPQTQLAAGGIGHIEQSENQPNASPLLDDSFRTVDIGFDAAWELDIWGRFRRGVEAADANLMAEVAGYDDALVSLTAEVASAYVAIRTFEARLAIARENVAIQERSLKIATVRFENGATTRLDVEQAKTLLANTRASIPDLEIGLRRARNALSILLGLPPGELGGIEDNEAKIPEAPLEIAIGIPADLIRRRPDIRRAELQAAAQSALIGIAKADLYPQFSLSGTVGLRASDTGVSDLGDLFDGDSLQAGFGPSFQWNILNYGRITNAVRVEDARFQQAVVSYRNAVLEAAREVEDALVAFVRGKQRVEFLKASVDAARRSVDLALIQYRDGAVDFTRVLDTQTFLVGQQDTHTAARGRVVRDLIATYKALGGGWQVRGATGGLTDANREDMDARTDWGGLLGSEAPGTSPGSGTFRKPDW